MVVAVQERPVCVTGIAKPAIVSVALRCEKLFSAAKKLMVAGPVPLALAVMESHGALDTAVQEHCDGSTRLMFRMPPLES